MKPLKYIIIISFMFIASASALNINEVMTKANEFYRSNDFVSAINEYEKLIGEGYQGTSLFYNLGNAYYRIGKIGYAILYYEKALKLSPSDDDVKHNLALANMGTIDKIETLPKFFLFDWWESFLAFLSLQGWIIFTLIVYFLLLAAIAIYFFAAHIVQQRISFFSGLAILIVLIVSVSVVTIKLNRENKRLEAVLVENTVVVKLSPDEHGKDGFVIHEGLKILLEDEVDSWKKIRLPDGKVGWIPSKYIRQI